MNHQIWKATHISDESHPEFPAEEFLIVEGLTCEQAVAICKELNKHFTFKVDQDEHFVVDEKDVVVYSALYEVK